MQGVYLSVFQIYIATRSKIHADDISIYEVYKIDHTDPDEPIQIRLLAKLTTADNVLDFMATKLRVKRRRNFFGKTLKTAIMLHPETLNKDGDMDSECEKKSVRASLATRN